MHGITSGARHAREAHHILRSQNSVISYQHFDYFYVKIVKILKYLYLCSVILKNYVQKRHFELYKTPLDRLPFSVHGMAGNGYSTMA
jgi:hypothetical protein